MTTFEKLRSMDDAHAKAFIAMMCTKAYVHGMMLGTIIGDNPDATEADVMSELEDMRESGAENEVMHDPAIKDMFKDFYQSLDKEEPSETEVNDA